MIRDFDEGNGLKFTFHICKIMNETEQNKHLGDA